MEYNKLNFDVDDLLKRKTFVKNLMQVINEWNQLKHENDSLVISIDAPWGSGKSYLLNMWKNWLISEENSDKKYAVTYYNAWENDDSDNAFIPLVYKLQQMDVYKENISLIDNVKQRSKDFLKSCAVALLKDGIKKAIGEETANLIGEGIDGATETEIENFFKQYSKYIEEKEKFRNALIDLIPESGKLIVFVDELDRCRPIFAVETLEIVKHYFNIQNIVFIFAVDLSQLSHSIATMYGDGMDSAGYLRRFFDVNINIPSGDIKQYIKTILKDFVEKMGYQEVFFDIVTNVYVKLRLSLRDIDKITNNFIVFCLFYKHFIDEKIATQPDRVLEILEVYLYFMALKYKYPIIYNTILKQEFIAYDNAPQNWDVIEMKYFISPNINEMLKKSQIGGAQKKDKSLIEKYGLDKINSDGLSFAEHIERTLEMFS
ncbi:MAG TPA: P-loop NTPase fold protein [Clostridia bacterium]|nr:P-loop NTPase fold protein [Clostridia bacterium]